MPVVGRDVAPGLPETLGLILQRPKVSSKPGQLMFSF